MHIIACTLQVFFQSKKHIDTCTLVCLHHVVQHIVGRIEESHRTDGKKHYIIIVTHARAECQPQQIAYHDYCQRYLHPYHIERNDIDGDKQSQQRDADTIKEYLGKDFPVLAIYQYQASRKHLYHHQNRELADGGWSTKEQAVFEPDAYNKIDDSGYTRKQNGTRHSLAIEHQKECHINKCRTRFTL